MLKLFKKELKLNVHPVMYLFALFGSMLLIPNYPYIVASGYVVLQIFYYLMAANQNMSMQFTSMLPTKRDDTVSATTLVIALFEVMNLAVMAIMIVPARILNPQGNLAGMDANLTVLGVSMLCLAMFNLVFLPQFFKTGYKIGMPVLWGMLAFLGTYTVCETLVQAVPVLNQTFEGYAAETVWARALLAGVGAAVFVLFTILGNKIAVKKFQKVNL